MQHKLLFGKKSHGCPDFWKKKNDKVVSFSTLFLMFTLTWITKKELERVIENKRDAFYRKKNMKIQSGCETMAEFILETVYPSRRIIRQTDISCKYKSEDAFCSIICLDILSGKRPQEQETLRNYRNQSLSCGNFLKKPSTLTGLNNVLRMSVTSLVYLFVCQVLPVREVRAK